jgi:hypothetical protein
MTGPQELREAFVAGAWWQGCGSADCEAEALRRYPDPPAPKPDNELEKELLAYISDTPALLSMLYDSDLLPEQTQGTGNYGRTLIIAIHWRRDHTPDPAASEKKVKCGNCGSLVPWLDTFREDGKRWHWKNKNAIQSEWCGPVEPVDEQKGGEEE